MTGPKDLDKYRTFRPRFWAGLIDGVVLMPLVWIDMWLWKNVTTTAVLIPWFIADSLSYVAYSVLLHGFFGQTIGKRLTKVKVYDVSGSKLSMKQAILRDCVYIGLVIYELAIELPTVIAGRDPYAEPIEFSGAFIVSLYASFGWFILELVTMLTNPKRRAIHDFIARSIVMRVDGSLVNTSEQGSDT